MKTGGGRGARRGAEKFYDGMDQSGKMTDRMAALVCRPTGTWLIPLSSGPIDRWVGVEEWKRRRVMEGLGVEGTDLGCAHD